jgi:hypothetical protein
MFADDGVFQDLFGFSIGVYSTTAMIGAYRDDDKAVVGGIIIIYLVHLP